MPKLKPLIKDKAYFEKDKEVTPEAKKKKRAVAKKKRMMETPRFKERILKKRQKDREIAKEKHTRYQKNRVNYTEREEDYLKFYAPIMNWASIKFAIPKEHLEIAFFFYNHPVFTREQFTELCIMFSKKSNSTFLKFVREGYIVGKELGTGDNNKEMHYRLSFEMIAKIKKIYAIMQLEKIPRDFDYTQNSSKRSVLQTTLRALQREVDSIESGKSSPDKIVFRNEEE